MSIRLTYCFVQHFPNAHLYRGDNNELIFVLVVKNLFEATLINPLVIEISKDAVEHNSPLMIFVTFSNGFKILHNSLANRHSNEFEIGKSLSINAIELLTAVSHFVNLSNM
jgi:hypothetical protein